MFFEKVFPEARPHFPRSARTFSVRVGHDEFRQIVGRKKYEDAFHTLLSEELDAYSLLLLKVEGYFLIIGWQDPAETPPRSYSDNIEDAISETKYWNDARFADEWDKEWP